MNHERMQSFESLEYEKYLHEKHLARITAEALELGEPVRFLAGLEVEFEITKDPIFEQLAENGPRTDAEAKMVKDTGLLLTDQSLIENRMTEAQQDEKEDDLREFIYEYLADLPVTNASECQRIQEWMVQIDNFDTSDLINFLLYLEFSEPTLADSSPPEGGSYEQMVANEQERGWLEFKFGQGKLQSGYYDNEGVSEMRFTPCSPEELVRREKIIMQRALEIATQFNSSFCYRGSHINLSAYNYDESSKEWQPIIGTKPSQAKSIDAISGVSAAIESGAGFSEELADKPAYYGTIGGMKAWEITPFRSSVRVKNGYVELREANLKASTAHGLLWMMSGVIEGLELGSQGLKDLGHNIAELKSEVKPYRTKNFNKDSDLQLLRALEKSRLSENDELEVEKVDKPNKAIKEWTGLIVSEAQASIAAVHLVKCLKQDPETGKLRLQRSTSVEDAYTKMCQWTKSVGLDIEALSFDDFLSEFTDFIARDTVRLDNQPGIYANPHLPNNKPDEWADNWMKSRVMRRMYGGDLPYYANVLYQKALKNYKEFDISSPESFADMISHYGLL